MAEEKRWLYDLVSDLAKWEAWALARQVGRCKEGDIADIMTEHHLTKLDSFILDLLSQAKFPKEAEGVIQLRIGSIKDSLLAVKNKMPEHLNARIEILITATDKLIAKLQE